VFRFNRLSAAAAILATAILPLCAAAAQQSDVTVSPFVTFLPTTGASPLAGLALTLAGNGPLALRASGHLSLETNANASLNYTSGVRPWGADADAVLFLGGRNAGGYRRTLAPYGFAGLGIAGYDNLGQTEITHNWSYGAGLSVPLGSAVDVFGESRWRMSQYVLPTAHYAPTPINELRFGISFHVGTSDGGGSGRGSRSASTPRHASRSVDAVESQPMSCPASTTVTSGATRLLGTAGEYIGAAYSFGGTTPSGFDCSGFTQYVFALEGVRLPRTAREQAQVGMALPAEWRAIAPGDLVLFAGNDRIDHVAIYAGHNRIIHSSASGGGVRYDDLSTIRGEWFVDHMVAARRVTPDARGFTVDLSKGFPDVRVAFDGPDHAPVAR
jgi:cell wall-associated NlpC family hydrolase